MPDLASGTPVGCIADSLTEGFRYSRDGPLEIRRIDEPEHADPPESAGGLIASAGAASDNP